MKHEIIQIYTQETQEISRLGGQSIVEIVLEDVKSIQ
jgi:hypothetical protein